MALLARKTDQGLEYAGGAAVALAQPKWDQFWREVERLASTELSAGMPLGRKAQRLRPELRVRARYLKGSGKLRHATFSGLESD